jgi:hypothetical protein
MSLASTIATSTEGLPKGQVAKRPRSARATSRQGSHVATKSKKVSFYLSPEAIRRLGIAATMTDSDKSRVLEAIIADAPILKRWVVSDRAKSDASAMSEVSSV